MKVKGFILVIFYSKTDEMISPPFCLISEEVLQIGLIHSQQF